MRPASGNGSPARPAAPRVPRDAAYLQQVRSTASRGTSGGLPPTRRHEWSAGCASSGATVEEVARWLSAPRARDAVAAMAADLPALQSWRAAVARPPGPARIPSARVVEQSRAVGPACSARRCSPRCNARSRSTATSTDAWVDRWGAPSARANRPGAWRSSKCCRGRHGVAGGGRRCRRSSADGLRALGRRLWSRPALPLSPVAAFAWLRLEALDQLELRGAVGDAQGVA